MTTIAYLGPEHTNTHLAAQAKFGRRARYVHEPTIDDVFHAVERRRADFGVVPVENSLEGTVTHTVDRFVDFIDSPVKIHGEIEQQIHHYLLVHPATKLSAIRIVFSHPQALAQCHRWLVRNLSKGVERWETSSTAEAAQYVVGQQLWGYHRGIRTFGSPQNRAAIGRRELAKTFGLQAVSIGDERENKTRFLVIGLGHPRRGRRNKTSLLFGVKDRPGALYDALVPFKQNRINLTKIESRPSKRKAWEYVFFIDFEGYETERCVKRALKALERSTALLRVLGSYPLGR